MVQKRVTPFWSHVPSGLRKGRYPLATTGALSGEKRSSTPPSAPPGVSNLFTVAPSAIVRTVIRFGLAVQSAINELLGEKAGRVPPVRVRITAPSRRDRGQRLLQRGQPASAGDQS